MLIVLERFKFVAGGEGAADLAAARALSPLFGRLRAAGADPGQLAAALQQRQAPPPARPNLLVRCRTITAVLKVQLTHVSLHPVCVV